MRIKTFFNDMAKAMREESGIKGKIERMWAFVFIPIVWISGSISVYLYFLQLSSTTLSMQRLLASALAGLAVTLGGIWLISRKPFTGMLFSRERLIHSFSGALICCVFLWILGTVPENLLFAKSVHYNFSIQVKGAITGPVEIIWINDGLGDVSFQAVKIPPNGSLGDQSIQIPLSAQTATEFSWSGRVWHQFVLVLRSPQPIGVTVDTGAGLKEFDIEGGSGDTAITIPAAGGWYYLLIGSLVYVFTFLSLAWLIFLFGFIRLGRSIDWLEKKIPYVPSDRAVALLGITAFVFISGFMVRIGFYNRMYADDYCYQVMMRQNGFFGAIDYAYLNQNGRVMSHLFNFIALSFGTGSIPYGPLVVMALVGGSLYFLITQLLVGEKKARYGTALFSTLFIMISTLLMLPDLYNSVFWTLHALIVSGGIFFFNLFLALLTRLGREKMTFRRQFWLSGLFCAVNILGANFNEAISLVSISLLGLIIVFLLFTSGKKPRKSSLMVPVLFSFAGSLIGLAIVLLAPGNNKRINGIGYETEFLTVVSRFFSVIHDNLLMILNNQGETGLVLIAALLLTGYAVGRFMPVNIRWSPDLSRLKFPPVLLALLPFGLSIVPFVTAAFVRGFFPARTLIVPIYFLNIFYFLGAVLFGYTQRSFVSGKKLLPYAVSLVLLIISITSYYSLENLSRSIRAYAAEWDAREVLIQQAVAAGDQQVSLRPFPPTVASTFIDISADHNHWFAICLENYYHIGVLVDVP